MALKSWRWVASTIAGMAMIMVLLFSWSPKLWQARPQDPQGVALQEVVSVTARRANRLAFMYRASTVADSLHAVFSRMPAQPVRVLIDPRLEPKVRTAVDKAAAKTLGRLIDSAGVPVDLAIIGENGVPFSTFGLNISYVLPRQQGARCVAIVRLTGGSNGYLSYLRRDDVAYEMLGPCAYYHAFGTPGRYVSDWIRDRAAKMTLGRSWDADLPLDYEGVIGKYERSYYAVGELGDRVVMCATGDTALCEQLATQPSVYLHPMVWGDNFSVRGTRFEYWHAPGSFGSREPELLANMVRTIGPERFRAFWTSGDSVPAAFRKATGTSLGAWISDWIERSYGHIESGPFIRPLSLFWAGLLTCGALAVSIGVSRRRVMG